MPDPRNEYLRTVIRDDPIRTARVDPREWVARKDAYDEEFRRIMAGQMVKDTAMFLAVMAFCAFFALLAAGLVDWSLPQ
jgi:hypothetical protein